MANPFCHTELASTDIAKSKNFYSSLFDWKLSDMDMGGGMTYTTFKPTGDSPGGGMMQQPVPGAPSAWLPYVLVDDVNAANKKVISLGGKVVKMENWGVRSLTYRMNKNRKAHFVLLNIDGPSAAVAEIERQERISEDVIRYLTVRVEEHEEGPSAMMRKADRDRDRDDRGGGGFRGDREGGGFRGGDREGGGYRGDRGPRRPRDDADAAVEE